MVKKKISGQTLAIIILAILLILAIAFGGVYALYSTRSNKVSGKIVMANLEIALESVTGESNSDKSEIIIYNQDDIVPGETLNNSSLVVKNLSSVSVYLIVVYEVKAQDRITQTKVVDEFKNPVLGIGTEYVNSVYEEKSSSENVRNTTWIDYVFNAEQEGKYYRCLVSAVSFPKSNNNAIEVIGEDKLSLSGKMGNEYKNTEISFTFQAFAIAAESGFNFTDKTTSKEKCDVIVNAIYESQGETFLKFI